jgi:hypothetical protein
VHSKRVIEAKPTKNKERVIEAKTTGVENALLTGGRLMRVTIELSDADTEEMVELGQQLLAVVERLEELTKRMEEYLDAN